MSVNLAQKVAKEFHYGQKYGEHDYFDYHVKGVVDLVYNQSPSDDETLQKEMIVAYLHDTVEDTPLTLRTIEIMFGEEIKKAVHAITYYKVIETRGEYYIRVKANKLARFVKICDAKFNARQCFSEGKIDKFNYYVEIVSLLGGSLDEW